MFIHHRPFLLNIKLRIRPRIVEKHYESLSPNISWIISDPIARVVFIVFMMLGYTTCFLGIDEFARLLEDNCPLYTLSLVSSYLPLTKVVIFYGWYITIVAHACEAIYTSYLTKTKLRLKTSDIVRWAILTFTIGLPMTMRVVTLVSIQRDSLAQNKGIKNK